MIEENKHIDKLFAAKLGERTFAVPDAFLADLEERLDAPKTGSKRIAGFWFWLSAIAISALATGTYFAMPLTNSSNNSVVSSVAKSPLMAMSSTPMSESSVFIEVQNQNNEKSFVPVERYKKTPDAFTPEKQKAIQEVKRTAAIKAKKIQDSILAAEKLRAEQLAASQGSSLSSTRKAGGQNGNGSSVNDPNNLLASYGNGGIDQTSIPENSALFNLLKKDKAFGEKNGEAKTLQYGQENISYVDDTLKNVRYIIRDTLITRDSLVTIYDTIFTEVPTPNTKPDLNNNAGKKWELQAFGGFMSVRPTIASPFETYSELLKNKETTILSPNFGFALNAYYKNFRFGTGGEYYHFGEDYDYSTLKTTETFTGISFDTTTTIKDSFGNDWFPGSQFPPFDTITVVSMDSTFVTDSTTAGFAGKNTYSRFVVPINFGYQFTYKDWAFTPRVGLNLEFTTAYRKGIYTNALNEEILELDQRKFGLSYRLQFEIRRNFENFHIFVNPYYQNNIGYIIDTPDLKRKYGGFGAQFGVGVKF